MCVRYRQIHIEYMQCHTRDLSICGFWYLQRGPGTNPDRHQVTAGQVENSLPEIEGLQVFQSLVFQILKYLPYPLGLMQAFLTFSTVPLPHRAENKQKDPTVSHARRPQPCGACCRETAAGAFGLHTCHFMTLCGRAHGGKLLCAYKGYIGPGVVAHA